MRVLVTGAAGRIGAGVVQALHEVGHDVVATDVSYRKGLPVPLKVADLLQPFSLHPLLEDRDTLVHLGNHPHSFAVRPLQRVLAENLTMNSYTWAAAREMGIRRVLFVSTIQTFLGRSVFREHDSAERFVPPSLPLHGDMPPDPGLNPYAQSKVFSEQMLDLWAQSDPEVSIVVARLPFVMKTNDRWAKRFFRPISDHPHRLSEGASYLPVEDVQSFVCAAVEKMRKGMRTYFPAMTPCFEGMTPMQAAAAYLPDVPIEGDLDALGGWVDRSAIEEDFGWTPTTEPFTVATEESSGS